MPRSRNIKPGFFRNADLLDLPAEYRILFEGLWTIADRDGRLEDRPSQIKMDILPGPREIHVDCDAALTALAEKDFIERYQIDGRRYIQITKFSSHQNPHRDEKKSTIPPKSKHCASTVLAQCSHDADTSCASCEHDEGTVVIGLIPDSLNLIPDSSTVVADATTKTVSDNVVHFVQKQSAAVDNSRVAVKKAVEQKTSSDVKLVFEYWKRRLFHEDAQLGESIEAKIREALGWGYSAEKLCAAIDGIRCSAFHMGANDTHTVHDGLKIILRDSEQVLKFIELAYGEAVSRRPCQRHPNSGLTDHGGCWGCYADGARGAGSAGD